MEEFRCCGATFIAGMNERPLIFAWCVVVTVPPIFFTCCSVAVKALEEMAGVECKKFSWGGKSFTWK